MPAGSASANERRRATHIRLTGCTATAATGLTGEQRAVHTLWCVHNERSVRRSVGTEIAQIVRDSGTQFGYRPRDAACAKTHGGAEAHALTPTPVLRRSRDRPPSASSTRSSASELGALAGVFIYAHARALPMQPSSRVPRRLWVVLGLRLATLSL